MKKTVKCPYCGTENIIEHWMQGSIRQQQVVSCSDERGLYCDKYFVVFSEVKLETIVKGVEGEGKL